LGGAEIAFRWNLGDYYAHVAGVTLTIGRFERMQTHLPVVNERDTTGRKSLSTVAGSAGAQTGLGPEPTAATLGAIDRVFLAKKPPSIKRRGRLPAAADIAWCRRCAEQEEEAQSEQPTALGLVRTHGNTS